MAWFKKSKAPLALVESKKVQMPEGLWTKCKNCEEIIYSKEIERNLNVCPKCDYHFRISARERIALVIDEGTFVETDPKMSSVDFLKFKDSKKYADRLKAAFKKNGDGDAVITGSGLMNEQEVVVAVFDFGYMGGRPSHPELLDFLAAELKGNGWKVKEMHRLIMNSKAYRQSSNWRKDGGTTDGSDHRAES